ncbi:MAG: uracil-DNA glycosylase [bacterium]|nr:uracil-DNA glycosylase [bacterium]
MSFAVSAETAASAETKDLAAVHGGVAACTQCRLSQGRTCAVPGEGSARAELLFIGEGPGKNEDLQGRPFVGAAGKFLDQMLEVIKLKREDVFITNVVKCRPPENRDPLPDEVATCTSAWLTAQLHHIDPVLIVTLGRHSLKHFIDNKQISACHGKPMRALAPDGIKRVFYPLYHPAAALYNGSMRGTLIEDFKKIPAVLKAAKELREKERLLAEMQGKES